MTTHDRTHHAPADRPHRHRAAHPSLVTHGSRGPRRTRRTRGVRAALASTTTLIGGFTLALAAPLSASAHVGLDATSTGEGSYTVLSFSTPHGCGESPTTRLTFSMPEGVNRVTPTVNPNWTVEKIVEELPEPLKDSHGANLVDRDARVVYTAVTPLPSDLRDVIELSLQLPADSAGETLAFPVLQECVEGAIDWSELAGDGDSEPDHPAPTLVVTAAAGDGHGHGSVGTSNEEHGTAETADETDAETAATSAPGDDPVARWLAIGGLAVGAAGLVLAAIAWRRPDRS